MENHYQKLARMYLGANINQQFFESTQIQIAHETASISIDVSEKYFHALGAMHGSVYFKLLDDAAFFAVQSVVNDAFVLTSSFNINLTRPVQTGKITAVGKLKFKSKNLYVAEATLTNEAGKEIGFGTGNFAKSKLGLTAEIGYK